MKKWIDSTKRHLLSYDEEGKLKIKGVLMNIDLHSKAVQLLEKIANSVHERDPKNPNLLCFSTTEVHLVEKWLEDFIQETKA